MPPDVMRKLLRIYRALLYEELGWQEAERRVWERIDQEYGYCYPTSWPPPGNTWQVGSDNGPVDVLSPTLGPK